MYEKRSYSLGELHKKVSTLYPNNPVIYYTEELAVLVLEVDRDKLKVQVADENGDNLPGFNRMEIIGDQMQVTGYDLIDELNLSST